MIVTPIAARSDDATQENNNKESCPHKSQKLLETRSKTMRIKKLTVNVKCFDTHSGV